MLKQVEIQAGSYSVPRHTMIEMISAVDEHVARGRYVDWHDGNRCPGGIFTGRNVNANNGLGVALSHMVIWAVYKTGHFHKEGWSDNWPLMRQSMNEFYGLGL
jgi:hypothetical protein